MSTIATKDMIEASGPYCAVPATPLDRALHRVNWFLIGNRALRHHNPGIKIKEARSR